MYLKQNHLPNEMKENERRNSINHTTSEPENCTWPDIQLPPRSLFLDNENICYVDVTRRFHLRRRRHSPQTLRLAATQA